MAAREHKEAKQHIGLGCARMEGPGRSEAKPTGGIAYGTIYSIASSNSSL